MIDWNWISNSPLGVLLYGIVLPIAPIIAFILFLLGLA